MAHFYELPLLKERHSRVLKEPYNVGPADGGEDDVETHYPIYLDDARTLACFEAARQVCNTMPTSMLMLWREQKGLVAHANNNAQPNVHDVLGDIVIRYNEAVNDFVADQADPEPYLEEPDTYHNLDAILCKLIQYLALKLTYFENIRKVTDADEWEEWERTTGLPLIMSSTPIVQLHAELDANTLIRDALSALVDDDASSMRSMQQQQPADKKKRDDDDDAKGSRRIQAFPKDTDVSSAELTQMLQNVLALENKAKSISNLVSAVHQNKTLRKRLNTWLNRRRRMDDYKEAKQSSLVDEFINECLKRINKPVNHEKAKEKLEDFEQGNKPIADFFDDLRGLIEEHRMAAAAADKKFMAKYTDDEVAGTALTKISKDFRRQLKKHLLSKNFDVETMTLEGHAGTASSRKSCASYQKK